jgi:hypothetical protein
VPLVPANKANKSRLHAPTFPNDTTLLGADIRM